MKHYIQGDVSLHRISKLPQKVERQEHNIVAYGEITGHEHRFNTERGFE